MPRVNLYLPAELHEAVKRAGIPVGEICKRALTREVRKQFRPNNQKPAGELGAGDSNRRP